MSDEYPDLDAEQVEPPLGAFSDKARALFRELMKDKAMTQYGWLIEAEDHSPRHRWLRVWRQGKGAQIIWTEDANVAMRFARREDAVNFAWLHADECTLALITEHGFDSGVPAQEGQR